MKKQSPEKIFPETAPPKKQPKNLKPTTPLPKVPPAFENLPQLPPISLKKSEMIPSPTVVEASIEERTKAAATAQKIAMEKALADLSRTVEETTTPAGRMPKIIEPAEFAQASATVVAPGLNSDYRELQGKLYLWRNQWYLRFAELGSSDQLGGSVRLMDNPWAQQLREGQTVRVGGRIATAASSNSPALYHVERLTVVADASN